MQKKFSFKNNRLAKTIVFSGSALIIVAFVILRYEGFFSIVSLLLSILRPVIIGGVIAFALNRPINFFHQKFRRIFFGMRQKISSKRKKAAPKKNLQSSGRAGFICSCITVYLLMFAAIVGIICFIVPQIADSATLFRDNFSVYADNVMNFVESNKFRIDYIMDKVDLDAILENAKAKLMELTNHIPDVVGATVDITSGIIGGIVDVFIGLVFSLYILMDKVNLKKQARVVTKSILKTKYYGFEKIVKLAYSAFSNFISGQLIEAIILGVLCFIGMSVFGFEYAPLISVIIGITNIIPIVGPILGTVPGALILLMINPIRALWFVVFIIIIQQIDSNIIYPKVVGSSIGLPGLWVLFAITVGGGLGGVLGMILAVPIASILYACLQEKVRLEEAKEALEEELNK